MRRPVFLVALVLALAASGPRAAAFSLQSIGSFDNPVAVVSSPDDPGRLLIAEREGTVVEVSAQGRRQLADLTALVSCCESERGLLSIAPAPDFEASGRLYVSYTGTTAAGGAEGDVHVDSFRPDPADAEALLREPILSAAHADEPNHNGGQLQFGPDGHLYVSFGDGGGTGDPFGNGQDSEALLGKILRIDPRPGEVPPYSIPAGNPFAAAAGLDEIWAYGLRNPWRFSFDRLTGDMVIGDVGQGAREEVDLAPSPGGGSVGGAGANYGWNCREGLIAYPQPSQSCDDPSAFVDPVFDYVHQDPASGAASGCSIIGGYVARDAGLGDLYGRYVYADYCIGQIRSLVLPASAGGAASGDRSEAQAVPNPTSFGEDACGRLYVASSGGPVYRFEGPTPTACTGPPPTSTPTGSTAPAPAGPASPPRSSGARPRLLLFAKRLRPGGSRFRLTIRLVPCLGNAGQPAQLSRNGRSFADRALNRSCVARFWLTVAKPTPVRAFARLSEGDGRAGSPRLVLMPPGPR